MKKAILFTLIAILAYGCVLTAHEMKLPINDGEYIFEHKFAEAEHHTIKSINLNITINKRHITVVNNDRFDVFPNGVIEEGVLMWHKTTKQWIIGNHPSDINAIDVGGCSEGPTVIDLEKRIYWTC